MQRIIGIDPGISGAMVAINPTTSEYVGYTSMPVLLASGKKTIDALTVSKWLATCTRDGMEVVAVLENVHAMPGQGVTSMFSFGRSFGAIEGVLGALAIPYVHVSPQKWKSKGGFHSKDKDEPRSTLIRRFPQWEELKLKGKGQALADAYFIAKSFEITF